MPCKRMLGPMMLQHLHRYNTAHCTTLHGTAPSALGLHAAFPTRPCWLASWLAVCASPATSLTVGAGPASRSALHPHGSSCLPACLASTASQCEAWKHTGGGNRAAAMAASLATEKGGGQWHRHTTEAGCTRYRRWVAVGGGLSGRWRRV